MESTFEDKRLRYIVGLDYGTTYSGMSFVKSSSRSIRDIEVINEWPKCPGTVWKAPSKIAYASETNPVPGVQWGYAVPPGAECYTWTKLLLDKEALPMDDPNLGAVFGSGMLVLPPGKEAEVVCEDYLRGMYKHLVDVLVKRYGSGLVQVTPIECWITVPALWSDKATELTRQAAVRAGFASRPRDSVNIVREPEAAALTVLKPYLSSQSPRPGDDVMICDCGGGTVDIATYRILSYEPRLEFKERSVGAGGKCGSTYIDCYFNAWMERTFGEAYTSLPLRIRGPGSRFMKSFEDAKKTFGREEADTPIIDIGYLDMKTTITNFYDAAERRVILPSDMMIEFFEPVIRQVIRLIENQLRATGKMEDCRPNRLILVGGFGDSAYLNTRLRAWSQQNGHIEVTCPPRPQAAVVKGAALRGLENIKAKFRRLRRHYGIKVDAPFRPGVDPPEKEYMHQWWKQSYCRDVMSWGSRKGDEIDEHKDTRYKLTLTRMAAEQNFDDTIDLYSCSCDEAPVYSDDPGVKRVGKVNVTFSITDVLAAEKSWSSEHGCYVYRLKYVLSMKYREGQLIFITLVEDKERGTARFAFA